MPVQSKTQANGKANGKMWGTASHARDLCLAALRALPSRQQREAVLGDVISALEHSRHATSGKVVQAAYERLHRYSMGLTD